MLKSDSKIKIMLIDDDEINNFVNSKLIGLHYPNTNIELCLSAKLALEKLNNGSNPDLILLDLNMPEINGWEFISQFRKIKKAIPVIILTSSVNYNDYNKSKQFTEVLDYIDKPLNKLKIEKIFNYASSKS
jgi:CheY-like chemotaxis protein